MLSSLTTAGRTALAILHTRGELLAVEIAQEQAQLARLALHAALGVVAAGLAFQMAAIFAVTWFWDTPYRLAVVAGAAGLFAVAGALCALAFARRLRNKPQPFGSSLRALQADIEALGAAR
jgi:uncharacterized membrane protein YqjE